MKQQHTPGPWVANSKLAIISEKKRTANANVMNHRLTYQEKKANARLIAAAWQMFEALDELVDLKDQRHKLAIETYQRARERAWEKCRAAIKAAKGGEQ